MAKNRQADPNEVVRLLVQARPNFMIEIPAHWRVTFSNAPNPQSHRGPDGYCLRVYEGEKLRAVYANVQGFRDLSIPMATENRKETGSSTWTKDSEGNFEGQENIQVEKMFVLEAAEEDTVF